MKRIVSLLLCAVFVVILGATASAADTALVFESSYNADTNQISVMVFVENPGEMAAADLRLGYNQDVFEFVESEDNETVSGMIAMSGLSVGEEGLVCTSVMFTGHCQESDLTDGRLHFATFIFKPLTEDYDINDFCLWAYSYDVDGKDISKTISSVGDVSLKMGKTEPVSVAGDNKNESVSLADRLGDKWYVYAIAVAGGAGIVAGVAVFAVKSSEKDSENKNNTEENKD